MGAGFGEYCLAGTPLDAQSPVHRTIRTLGMSVFSLSQILHEQGSPNCVAAYEEFIQYYQHIQVTAEAVYQRSLDGWAENDILNRSKTIKQIDMVHHAHFSESRQRGEASSDR